MSLEIISKNVERCYVHPNLSGWHVREALRQLLAEVQRLGEELPRAQPAASADDEATVPADLAAAIKAYHDGPMSDDHVRTLMGYVRQYGSERDTARAALAELTAAMKDWDGPTESWRDDEIINDIRDILRKLRGL